MLGVSSYRYLLSLLPDTFSEKHYMAIKVRQIIAKSTNQLKELIDGLTINPQLILSFGPKALLSELLESKILSTLYPNANLIGCTTAGEIAGTRLLDASLVLTLAEFKHTSVKQVALMFSNTNESLQIGRDIAKALIAPDLTHVFILSDGLNINGSKLVEGLREVLPKNVAATGGLAGDGPKFQSTSVLANNTLTDKIVVGIGFYGSALKVGFGSLGGWDPFGPERTVTKAEGNVLYELDGRPALSLYKDYLGEMSQDLPASGLLFPLTVKIPGCNEPLVRTLLAVDESKNSLTLAGEIPLNCQARLMKANIDRLLDGAQDAGNIASLALSDSSSDFAILISCVGRRLVMKQRTEDELDSVREQLGADPILTGFYSYGEIAPFMPHARCELHNQTMTVTAFKELE